MDLCININKASPVPLYAQFAQELRNCIYNGSLESGSKLPSENQFSEQYGLSRMTVRNALSQLAHEGYIEKLQGKGTFVCFKKSVLSGNIDVLLDVSYTYFAMHYIQSISDVLSSRGYSFVIHDTRDSQKEICGILEGILEKSSAGIILQPSHRIEPVMPELKAILARISAHGIPYIMLDHVYEGVPGLKMIIDEYGGGRVAAEYLTDLGHRKIAMVCHSDFYENKPRMEGFQSVLDKRGCESLLLLEADDSLDEKLPEVIRSRGITAVFNYNDEVALKSMQILHKCGICIPEEVSIVGYDDTVIAAATNPQLTSVIHPKDALGRMAAEKVISLVERYDLEQPLSFMTPKLHIRASCCPPGVETE